MGDIGIDCIGGRLDRKGLDLIACCVEIHEKDMVFPASFGVQYVGSSSSPQSFVIANDLGFHVRP